MKRPGRILGNLLAMLLTVASLQAFAETQLGGRDFNHATTGFLLSGGHATAACETCHVGGVFKGTPKNCDDCHALGKRVVATPKSTSHIVTIAPCQSCHFNTATFFGARYNHAAAIPGQCMTCHNGRQATAKPASHSSGTKATNSCDSCHRSSAWSPASWNHIGVIPGSCENAGCHLSGANQYFRPADHNSPIPYTIYSKGTYQCDACHGFIAWIPASFKHNVAGTCESCHTMKPLHIATTGASCGSCHKTRSNGWLPASNHSGNEAGICRTCHAATPQPAPHATPEYIALSCDVCHKSQTTWTGASGHFDLVPPHVPTCRSCHSAKAHDGKNNASASMDCSRSGCHRPGGSEGKQFSEW